jgi:hypothetical protein
MNARLKKLSVCGCGFPVLAEHIEIGAEYKIDRNIKEQLLLICGGCGVSIPVQCVFVHGGKSGFLPEEIFEDIED